MSGKHVVVQGAKLKCKFNIEQNTDILKVKTQNKHFANDKDAEKKRIATTKEIGQTMEKNTFGKCEKKPDGKGDYLPCQCVITEWTGFYKKVTLSNQGKILIETSKAGCTIGGPDCITVDNHGQQVELGKQNAMSAKPDLSNQINPLVDMRKFQNNLVGDDIL
ncbi:DUF4280 domain-containing protein [Flavobacterium daemonense]|uniref:DUF4280 domain-containing protein n=1 Tax=Flavobacterium daemonense TaxID=1393049 RepID=UPI001184AA71|nr:DUF4280 domain-containing protein [Flavobacterium daemonense]KAF2333765.1 DUF4280 domain-containing protein [Flavobacterium daemonense]